MLGASFLVGILEKERTVSNVYNYYLLSGTCSAVILQWSLQERDTLGISLLSFVERSSLPRRFIVVQWVRGHLTILFDLGVTRGVVSTPARVHFRRYFCTASCPFGAKVLSVVRLLLGGCKCTLVLW